MDAEKAWGSRYRALDNSEVQRKMVPSDTPSPSRVTRFAEDTHLVHHWIPISAPSFRPSPTARTIEQVLDRHDQDSCCITPGTETTSEQPERQLLLEWI